MVTVATVFLKVKEVSVKCIDFKFLHRQSLQPVSELKATTNVGHLNRSCLGILHHRPPLIVRSLIKSALQ